MNRIVVDGFIGKDAELKTVGNNLQMLTFSIGDSHKAKDKEPVTTWWNVALFGKSATPTLAASLKKGTHVIAEGRAQEDTFKGKDGTDKKALKLYANSIGVVPAEAKQAASEGSYDIDNIPF